MIEQIRFSSKFDSCVFNAVVKSHFVPLVAHANDILRRSGSYRSSGEDIVQSVLCRMVKKLRANELPDQISPQQFFLLLKKAVRDRAIDSLREQIRLKRGGGMVHLEVASEMHSDNSRASISSDGDSETAIVLIVQRLLDELGDDELRRFAQAKLYGYSNAEIAQEQKCSVRTVERKLNLIRRIWSG